MQEILPSDGKLKFVSLRFKLQLEKYHESSQEETHWETKFGKKFSDNKYN